jgi:hypothetical protein
MAMIYIDDILAPIFCDMELAVLLRCTEVCKEWKSYIERNPCLFHFRHPMKLGNRSTLHAVNTFRDSSLWLETYYALSAAYQHRDVVVADSFDRPIICFTRPCYATSWDWLDDADYKSPKTNNDHDLESIIRQEWPFSHDKRRKREELGTVRKEKTAFLYDWFSIK